MENENNNLVNNQLQKPGRKLPGWLSRTGHMFCFEQFMALGSLLVVGFSLSIAWFGLFNLIKPNSDYQSVSTTLATWLLVVMIVWLPVAAFFFLRYRGQAEATPELGRSRLARFFGAAYLVITIVSAIGFVFAAIFALINSAANLDQSVSDMVVKVSVPALLSALVMAGLATAVMRPGKWLSRGKFMLGLSVLGLAVTLTIFIWAVAANRGYAADNQAMNDIQAIHTQMEEYYTNNQTLPASLNQLSDLPNDVQGRLGDYQYLPGSGARYQLCTDFNHADKYYSSSSYSPDYSSYVDYYHPAGNHCFKLLAGYEATPFDSQNSSNLPSPDTGNNASDLRKTELRLN